MDWWIDELLKKINEWLDTSVDQMDGWMHDHIYSSSKQ